MAVRLEGLILQVGGLGSGQPVTVSLSGTTTRSSQITAIPRVVRLWSSVDCFVRFGDSTVTATTSSHPLTASTPEVFWMDQNEYIAGIVSSGTGTLFISTLSF